ncbi:MAG TPA: Nramp family divalent metal transporter [candidate division Zixibacteria bacterium]|nr:Nramp family divalent metal transporter [candidate division Zixibacteria bacterium]
MANDPEPKKRSSWKDADASTLAVARDVLAGGRQKGPLKRMLPFMGPAFIAAVAYVDPGNFATNIEGGAKFGYTLLWVIVASNLMAMLIQTLSAKLGIATGLNLAEQCRLRFPKWIVYSMWVLMELVAMATDLAEFLGAALGFNLLLGVPLLIGGVLTAIATFLILSLERYGFRPLEAVITAMVSMIAVCYVLEIFLGDVSWAKVAYHSVVPQFKGTESVLLATGIVGATIMPHAIFLHSALTQGRIRVKEPTQMRKLFRFQILDVIVAMGIASFVNMAMLIMSAATFHEAGLTNVASIEEAHRTLVPLLGKAASWVFAISLLAAGLSSSTVGTSAGQVIMQGFIKRHIPVWVRRAVTIVPSLLVIGFGLDPTRTLVISQVILSFGLPFAVIPLVIFTRKKEIMGVLANHRATTVVAVVIAVLIILLNLYLLYQTFFGG